MSNVAKESDFISFMHVNGPHSDGGKRNYISWLRYIADNIENVDDLLTEEKIDKINAKLKSSKKQRDIYTSDPAISDIKSALKKYLSFIKQSSPYSNTTIDITSIIDNELTTQQKQEIDARVGHGKYKKELIKIWGMCSLTRYSNVNFLIASHIKPWKSSETQEKIDPYNGLLLKPNIDKLFDSGYISFRDNGDIIISKRVTDDDLNNMGVAKDMKLFNVFEKNKPYLKYHRDVVFIK